MTTVAALQCVENNLLALDEDVSAILPELKSPNILTEFDSGTNAPIFKKATKRITLRQLLTHTSGLGYEWISPMLKAWKGSAYEDSSTKEGEIVSVYLVLPYI